MSHGAFLFSVTAEESSLPDVPATVFVLQKATVRPSRGCEPPLRCLSSQKSSLSQSVGHNVILAHAYAVQLYRRDYKPEQHGVIGITLNGDWAMPYDDSPESEC